jgi:hypothetical protein
MKKKYNVSSSVLIHWPKANVLKCIENLNIITSKISNPCKSVKFVSSKNEKKYNVSSSVLIHWPKAIVLKCIENPNIITSKISNLWKSVKFVSSKKEKKVQCQFECFNTLAKSHCFNMYREPKHHNIQNFKSV